MYRMTIKILAVMVAALIFAGTAAAKGGSFAFDGGTPFEQQQVTQALAVSSFDFSQVTQAITVHIVPSTDPHLAGGTEAGYSTPGDVWLSTYWLEFGQLGWGIVQHEFAHEIDYYVLTDAQRADLLKHLDPSGSTTSWCDHAALYEARPCEWFASELAYAFWPSDANIQAPNYTGNLSGHMTPTAFRAELDSLGLAQPQRVCTTRTIPGHWKRVNGKRVWIRRHTVRTCTLRP